MDEIKMTQEEFEILDRILSGLLHGTERLAVIASIDKEGFSRRQELDVDAVIEVMHENRTRDYGGTAIEYEDFRKVATAICKRFKNGKS